MACLAASGVQRLVLLGGAQLTADLLQADAVDEMQLTLVPQLLGGGEELGSVRLRITPRGSGLPSGLATPGNQASWRERADVALSASARPITVSMESKSPVF